MRIGLYGLPSSGKTYILNKIGNFEVVEGSKGLFKINPRFKSLTGSEQQDIRKQFVRELKEKDNIIVDGHYSFGENTVFTEDDGELYDTFLYLYVDPLILKQRMNESEKNCRYATLDIKEWQNREISQLRDYCHRNDKDFYVIDNPPKDYFADISVVLDFIKDISQGFSCLAYARRCVEDILKIADNSTIITLLDGDKTIITEDSCAKMGYKTHIFDNNFYTGYQSWRHNIEFTEYMKANNYTESFYKDLKICFNSKVITGLGRINCILTAGYNEIWKKVADDLEMQLFCDSQMAAETKFFITKYLQEHGNKIIAYGDGMNDYYMLRQADEAFLVAKKDGTLSRSLVGKKIEGLNVV